jgi:hypothetical protein
MFALVDADMLEADAEPISRLDAARKAPYLTATSDAD